MAEVVHVPDASRFEIHVDGEVAGFVRYREKGDAVDLVHTEIDDTYEGQGLGSELARGALDQLRSEGRRVIASCPFIRDWIEEHEDYQDLVA